MAVVYETKNCIVCGDRIRGRSDKKFCNDYCKNSFNNQQKANGKNGKLVRNINSSLIRNRKILATLVVKETAKATKEKLVSMGFQFKYYTHSFTNRAGKIYLYCYDFGYLDIGNDWYLLVKRKEE